MIVEGERELAASDAAFDRGDLLSATAHARRAALAYAPGAPHVDRAYARLGAVAIGAETAQQPAAAERAWQAMREAALETRHLWVPRAKDLARANAAIARLQSAQRPAAVEKQHAADGLAELARRPGTSVTSTLALLSSFMLVAFGLGWIAARGAGPGGGLRRSRMKLGLCLVAAGVAIWTLAALRA
jgi:hypothetical protein